MTLNFVSATITWGAVPGSTGYKVYRNGTFLTQTKTALKASGVGITSGDTISVVAQPGGQHQDATVTWSAPSPPPPPATSNSGAGTVIWGSASNNMTISDLAKLDMMVSDLNYPAAPADLPKLFHYFYRSLQTSCPYDCSIPRDQVVANNWYLKDTSGNPVLNAGYPSGWCLDTSNKAMSQAWGQNAVKWAQQYGYKGIFGDDCNRGMAAFVNVTPVGWDQAKWHASLVQHVGIIAGILKSAGLKFYVNASTWKDGGYASDDMNFMTELAQAGVSGVEKEYWLQWPGTQSTPFVGADWNDYRAFHSHCNGLGIDFIPHTYANTDTQMCLLARATHLLDRERDGSQMVMVPFDLNFPPGYLVAGKWSKDMGAPLGPATQNGNIWTRHFANGTVTVDSGAGVGTIS